MPPGALATTCALNCVISLLFCLNDMVCLANSFVPECGIDLMTSVG